MKVKYTDINMQKTSLLLVEWSNTIIEDYQARGYELTLRQLYYQLVARDLIANSEKLYNKLGITISNARLVGMVDWDAIVDRTRERDERSTWASPSSIIKAVARQYRIDKWEGQPYRVFVWVEKEALAGVVEAACIPNHIQADFISCRGYMSQSTIWREGRNLQGVYDNGQTPVILHLGDHDPSGIDMTRDNIERLETFSELNEGEGFIFERIALNYPQIEQYKPPPNPTKMSDSRAGGYVAEFGKSSWELDALDPDVLVALIQKHIQTYQDFEIWATRETIETSQREQLQNVADNWERVIRNGASND